MATKELKRTKYGFDWDDMSLTCLFDDKQGRVYMQIKRGKKIHRVYVTKTGKVVVNEIEEDGRFK